MNLEPMIQSEVLHIYGIQKDGTDETICRAAMEIQTKSTDLWTQWGRRGRHN